MALSVTLFIRNVVEMPKPGSEYSDVTRELTLSDGKKATLEFGKDECLVIDCSEFNRKERFEICSFINEQWLKEGKHARSVQSLSSEMLAHKIGYQIGFMESHTKDAGLTVDEDPRWYVRFVSKGLEVLGL